MQRASGQLSEMGDATHFESGSIPNGERSPEKEESIIRTKSRVGSGSLGGGWGVVGVGFGWEILFCKHGEFKHRRSPVSKSCVTRGFKIPGNVKNEYPITRLR